MGHAAHQHLPPGRTSIVCWPPHGSSLQPNSGTFIWNGWPVRTTSATRSVTMMYRGLTARHGQNSHPTSVVSSKLWARSLVMKTTLRIKPRLTCYVLSSRTLLRHNRTASAKWVGAGRMRWENGQPWADFWMRRPRNQGKTSSLTDAVRLMPKLYVNVAACHVALSVSRDMRWSEQTRVAELVQISPSTPMPRFAFSTDKPASWPI